MKSVSALFISAMISAAHAKADHGEHGVLLQVMSGHKTLTVAGSTSQKTTELQTLVDNIAEENRGRTLGKDIKTTLGDIKGMIETMKKTLSVDHKAAMKVTTDAFQELKKCNDEAATGNVTTAQAGAASAKTKHSDCRGEEVTAFATALGNEGSCTTFKTKLKDAMACSEQAQTEVVAEHERMLVIFAAATDAAIAAKKTNCTQDLTAYEDKNRLCQQNQEAFENATCEFHQKSYSVCGELETCYAKTNASYATKCQDMIAPRDERQTQALVLESVVCKIDKLLAKTPSTVEALAKCVVKANETITKPLDFQCAKALERKACTWPATRTEVPGVDNWSTANYAADWFKVATNDVEKQSRISAKIKCKLDTSKGAVQ